MNQILNMIMRMVMRKLLNKGINKGFDLATGGKNRGGHQQTLSPEEREARKEQQQNQKRIKQAARVTRKMGKF